MQVKVAKSMQFREDYPKKHNLTEGFHERVPRVSKIFQSSSIFSRLVGWMSPEYAEKFSLFALRDYLSTSPLSAALVVQSSWAVLAMAPIKQQGSWHIRLPAFGWTWLLALVLGTFSMLTHAMWYKSFTSTTPAINTLVPRFGMFLPKCPWFLKLKVSLIFLPCFLRSGIWISL